MTKQFQYKAFLSYSHADEKWASWLHRALESYRTPRHLIGRDSPLGPVPARLSPVFRDRDEFASSPDLSERIDQALASSEQLIVLCSPQAARSKWVDQEVRRFKALGRSRFIHCLVLAGDPAADSGDQCCFPPAIRQHYDEAGVALPAQTEPIAADLRPGADGKYLARLKLIAGLLGVGLDELRQRETQRRLRRMLAMTIAALLGTSIATALAVKATLASQESELRRAQGERLIDFMLVKFRAELEPIGKLDILNAVGDEALEYFNALKGMGTPEERLSRAVALRQIGDIRFNQGDLDKALEAFEESIAVLAQLNSDMPDNEEHMFQFGQSHFWRGYVAWQRGDLSVARDALVRYLNVSRALLDAYPDNPAYHLEMSYAHTNLGSIAVEQGDQEEALSRFVEAASFARAVTAVHPDDAEPWLALHHTQSWLGSVRIQRGELGLAATEFGAAVESAKHAYRIESTPPHRHLLAAEQINQGMSLVHLGEITRALAILREAESSLDQLVRHDPDNASWYRDFGRTKFRIAELVSSTQQSVQPVEELQQALEVTGALWKREPGSTVYTRDLAAAEGLYAQQLARVGQLDAAYNTAERALDRLRLLASHGSMRTLSLDAALLAHTFGAIAASAGNDRMASEAYEWGLAQLPQAAQSGLLELAARRLLLHAMGGMTREIDSVLSESGLSDPRFAYWRIDGGTL